VHREVLAEIIRGLDQWWSNLSKWCKLWIYANCTSSNAIRAISLFNNDKFRI